MCYIILGCFDQNIIITINIIIVTIITFITISSFSLSAPSIYICRYVDPFSLGPPSEVILATVIITLSVQTYIAQA
jgi:hypothetical protein